MKGMCQYGSRNGADGNVNGKSGNLQNCKKKTCRKLQNKIALGSTKQKSSAVPVWEQFIVINLLVERQRSKRKFKIISSDLILSCRVLIEQLVGFFCTCFTPAPSKAGTALPKVCREFICESQ